MRTAMNGMTIEASRDDLVLILKKNLAAHKEAYDEAVAAYKEAAVAELRASADAIEGGVTLKVSSDVHSLRPPTSYEKTYSEAIEMLGMHAGETIALSADQYRCFVKDQWGWREEFLHLNSTYEAVSAKYKFK